MYLSAKQKKVKTVQLFQKTEMSHPGQKSCGHLPDDLQLSDVTEKCKDPGLHSLFKVNFNDGIAPAKSKYSPGPRCHFVAVSIIY